MPLNDLPAVQSDRADALDEANSLLHRAYDTLTNDQEMRDVIRAIGIALDVLKELDRRLTRPDELQHKRQRHTPQSGGSVVTRYAPGHGPTD